MPPIIWPGSWAGANMSAVQGEFVRYAAGAHAELAKVACGFRFPWYFGSSICSQHQFLLAPRRAVPAFFYGVSRLFLAADGLLGFDALVIDVLGQSFVYLGYAGEEGCCGPSGSYQVLRSNLLCELGRSEFMCKYV